MHSMEKAKTKILYFVTFMFLFLIVYMIGSSVCFGKVYFMFGNNNKNVYDIVDLQRVSKDFQIQDDTSFKSISPDPWFDIKEPFPVKTIVVNISEISEIHQSQVFFYSEHLGLEEGRSYYFRLKNGTNYIQIPNDHYNMFRLDLTDCADVNIKIDNIIVYGSRILPAGFLFIVVGIWGVLSLIIYRYGKLFYIRVNIEKRRKELISALLAVGAIYGVAYMLKVTTQSSNLFGNIIFVPCIFWMFKVYLRYFSLKKDKKFYVVCTFYTILFSTLLILGAQLDALTDIQMSVSTLFAILCMSCTVYPVLYKVTSFLDDYNINCTIFDESQSDKKIAKICMVLVAISWFLIYFALFPGVYGIDAHYWYFEYSNKEIPISSQWSVIYSGAFYYFVELGNNIFGSYEVGFGIFSFIQMCITLWVVWNILDFLRTVLGNKAVVLGTVFFAIIPSHAVLSVTSAQDALFAALFAMCLIQLYKISMNSQKYFASKRNLISLLFDLIFLCMIRNNGLYAVVILGLFSIIIEKKFRLYFVSIIGTVIIFMIIYQGPIYDLFGVQKGTAIREMLSMPLQQMAYIYNREPNKLSDDDMKEMLKFISDEGWRSYEECISDHVKSQLNAEYTHDHFGDFVKLYIKVGTKSPGGYFKAASLQTFGLWYPNKIYPDGRTWHPYLNYVCYDTKGVYGSDFTISRNSMLPMYEKYLAWFFGQGDDFSGYGGNLSMVFSKIPIISLFIKSGIYFWTIIYVIGYCVYKKLRMPFLVMGLVIGLIVTVVLSPVILYRYMAPVIFSFPIYLAVLFTKWDSEKAK